MRNYQKRRIWRPRSLMTVLAAIVVFCTTYALILPAITMEQEDFSCGKAAHTHGAECYQLDCGQQEIIYHTHEPECYDAAGELTCGLQERVRHVHDDNCYTHVLTCTLPEGHIHGPECYADQPVLTCAEEHEHTEECFTMQKTLTCTQEENGHVHGDSCYGRGDFVCTIVNPEEHIHSENCYRLTCELEEHVHSDLCISSNEGLLGNLDELLGNDQSPEGSDFETPGIETPDFETPDFETPDFETPDFETPDFETPDFETPDFETPDFEIPEDIDPENLLICEEEHEHTEECYLDLKTLGELGLQFAVMNGKSTTWGEGEEDLGKYIQKIGFVGNGLIYDSEQGQFKAVCAFDFRIPVTDSGNGGTVPSLNYDMVLQNLDLKKLLDDKVLSLDSNYDLRDLGVKCGTFQFYEKSPGVYGIKVNLLPGYVSEAREYLQGNIRFDCYLDNEAIKDNNTFTMKYESGANLTVTVPYPEGVNKDHDVQASKTGKFIEANNKLVYEVIIKSERGSGNQVTFTDTMTGSLDQLAGTKTCTVSKGTLDASGNLNPSSESNPVSKDPFTSAPGKIDMNLQLDALAAGEYYRVTYTYDLAERTEGAYNYKFENGVTVKSGTSDKPISSTPPKIEIPISSSYQLKKSGETKDGIITWTVVVNSGQLVLNNFYLTDPMLKEALADPVIEPASPKATVDKTNGKITFPPDAGKTQYTVTYQTRAPGDFGQATVSNTAKLWDSGNQEKATATAGAGTTNGGLEKTETNTVQGSDGKYHISWRVMVDVPESGIKAETTIEDFCDAYFADISDPDKSAHLIVPGTVAVVNGEGQPVGFQTVFYKNQNKAQEDIINTPAPVMVITLNEAISKEQGPLYVTYETVENKKTSVYWNKVGSAGLNTIASASPLDPPSFEKLDAQKNPATSDIYEADLNVPGSSPPKQMIKWVLRATLGNPAGSSFTVEDALPSFLRVDKIIVYMYTLNQNSKYQYAGSGEIQRVTWEDNRLPPMKISDDKYRITATDGENNTFTITVDGGENEFPPKAMFEFTCECTVVNKDALLEAASSGKYEIKNTAVAKIGKYTLSDDHSYIFRAISDDTVLSKQLISTPQEKNDNRLHYEVLINKTGATINGGKPVKVTDVMTYSSDNQKISLRLDRDSVALIDVDTEQEVPKTEWSIYNYAETSTKLENNKVQDERKLVLMVPDGRKLKLEYVYQAVSTLAAGESATLKNIQNAVNVAGDPMDYNKVNTSELSYSTASASGSITTVARYNFLKTNRFNDALPNAVFAISKAVKTSAGWEWQRTSVTETSPGDQVRSEYTTDPQGQFTVEMSHGYQENVLYMLEEIVPPEGYQLPTKRTIYPFYFGTNEDAQSMPPKDSDMRQGAKNLNNGSDEEWVFNDKLVLLPDTGGMGTPLVSVSGLLLFTAAGTVLSIQKNQQGKYTKKRGKKQ